LQDVDEITITYPGIKELMYDLKGKHHLMVLLIYALKRQILYDGQVPYV